MSTEASRPNLRKAARQFSVFALLLALVICSELACEQEGASKTQDVGGSQASDAESSDHALADKLAGAWEAVGDSGVMILRADGTGMMAHSDSSSEVKWWVLRGRLLFGATVEDRFRIGWARPEFSGEKTLKLLLSGRAESAQEFTRLRESEGAATGAYAAHFNSLHEKLVGKWRREKANGVNVYKILEADGTGTVIDGPDMMDITWAVVEEWLVVFDDAPEPGTTGWGWYKLLMPNENEITLLKKGKEHRSYTYQRVR